VEAEAYKDTSGINASSFSFGIRLNTQLLMMHAQFTVDPKEEIDHPEVMESNSTDVEERDHFLSLGFSLGRFVSGARVYQAVVISDSPAVGSPRTPTDSSRYDKPYCESEN